MLRSTSHQNEQGGTPKLIPGRRHRGNEKTWFQVRASFYSVLSGRNEIQKSILKLSCSPIYWLSCLSPACESKSIIISPNSLHHPVLLVSLPFPVASVDRLIILPWCIASLCQWCSSRDRMKRGWLNKGVRIPSLVASLLFCVASSDPSVNRDWSHNGSYPLLANFSLLRCLLFDCIPLVWMSPCSFHGQCHRKSAGIQDPSNNWYAADLHFIKGVWLIHLANIDRVPISFLWWTEGWLFDEGWCVRMNGDWMDTAILHYLGIDSQESKLH